jgi:hypothetical protein
MLRLFAITCLGIVFASPCFGQGLCYAAPGAASLEVPLVPNSMEPSCEPQRIRVPDRTQVTLNIVNVSPTEYCTPTAPAPTPTTVTNPIESIINTVSGLKSFNLVPESTFKEQIEAIPDLIQPDTSQHLTEAEKNAPRDPIAKLFHELAEKVLPAAQAIATKQSNWQQTYQTDLTALQDYQNADYRGQAWKTFDPLKDAKLNEVRKHITFPPITDDAADPNNPPSEMDYVPLQALIDQLKALQPQLISACTAAPTGKKKCSPEILASTSAVIEKVNSYLAVAGDNLKTLQTAQTGVVTAYNALLAQKHQFDLRKTANAFVETPQDPTTHLTSLVQVIPLGTNYAATSPGTVSCATTATPSVATTDAINVSILYQNVPTLTASAGILVSFTQQNQYGIVQQMTTATATTPATTYSAIGLTSSARAGVVPMAFFNIRVAPAKLTTWWHEPNNELIITHNVSAGLGINSNSGTNQAEFFGGYAVGFSRVLIHGGLDYGRSQGLAPGFSTGALPTGFTGTSVPVAWKYHPQFSIGFSVRVAPF